MFGGNVIHLAGRQTIHLVIILEEAQKNLWNHSLAIELAFDGEQLW